MLADFRELWQEAKALKFVRFRRLCAAKVASLATFMRRGTPNHSCALVHCYLHLSTAATICNGRQWSSHWHMASRGIAWDSRGIAPLLPAARRILWQSFRAHSRRRLGGAWELEYRRSIGLTQRAGQVQRHGNAEMEVKRIHAQMTSQRESFFTQARRGFTLPTHSLSHQHGDTLQPGPCALLQVFMLFELWIWRGPPTCTTTTTATRTDPSSANADECFFACMFWSFNHDFR